MSVAGINMESGDLMSATLAYDGTVLTETVTDTVTNAVYTKTYTVNIPSLVGGSNAIVGFGAGTGAASVTANLDSWTYTVQSPGQAATPTFSPATGTYTGTQHIALSSSSTGAVVCYNTVGSPATNGATGCNTGTLYAAPVSVPASESLYAVAGGTGYSDSPVVNASYVIQSAVTTPFFSPAPGAYTAKQSVIISDSTANATLYYTTDGTTPTTASIRYSSPITVDSTETLKAIAIAPGDANSAVASAAYTVNLIPVVATPVYSPPGAVYSAAQSVTISDTNPSATIYYTTDGSAPTTSSTRYTSPIEISSTGTVRSIAAAAGDTNSDIGTANYIISAVPVVATPTFLPTPGVYMLAQSVAISDATTGATIYYTTDGTTPTTSSTPYGGPLAVGATETIQAIAVFAGDVNSSVASGAYIVSAVPVVATPTFSLAAGAYTSAQPVSIFDTTAGATVYYTTDGSMPTLSSTLYTGTFMVSATETLQAIAVLTGDTSSAVASAAYTIGPAPAAVAAPTFSPMAGAYTAPTLVTISDAVSGAAIYYTMDGSIPTTLSTVYSGPITVSSTETLQAIAAAAGNANSGVASAAYTIVVTPPTVATPVFAPPAGSYSSAQSVMISDATAGAMIYFTTDGSMPTTSSTVYTGPITVSSTETLQAIASAAGDTTSAVVAAAYMIAAPSFTLNASPATLTAAFGGQGMTMLTVTPQNGFSSPVTFLCSGLPSGTSCIFSPSTVTPFGAAASTQLTISASAQTSAAPAGSGPYFPLTDVSVDGGSFWMESTPRLGAMADAGHSVCGSGAFTRLRW